MARVKKKKDIRVCIAKQRQDMGGFNFDTILDKSFSVGVSVLKWRDCAAWLPHGYHIGPVYLGSCLAWPP